jgi:hypothetical protein
VPLSRRDPSEGESEPRSAWRREFEALRQRRLIHRERALRSARRLSQLAGDVDQSGGSGTVDDEGGTPDSDESAAPEDQASDANPKPTQAFGDDKSAGRGMPAARSRLTDHAPEELTEPEAVRAPAKRQGVARLERLFDLTSLLLETPRPLAAAEIRERLGSYSDATDASRRFEKDMEILQGMGVPIEVEEVPGAGPGVKAYRIPKDRAYRSAGHPSAAESNEQSEYSWEVLASQLARLTPVERMAVAEKTNELRRHRVLQLVEGRFRARVATRENREAAALIWLTEAFSGNADALEPYIEIAEREGDSELVEFFRRAHDESRRSAEQGRQLLEVRGHVQAARSMT